MQDDFQELKADMSLEDILSTIRSNCRVVADLRREIERLEKAEKEEVVEKPTTVLRAKISQEVSSTPNISVSDDIGEEASYFIDTNMDLYDNPEELKEQLRYLLPARTNSDYHRIIQRVRMNYIKLFNEYVRLVESEKSSFNKMDIELLMAEANKYMMAANVLRELEYEKEKENEEASELNRVVFMMKGTGKTYIEDDLSGLTDEHLEGFALLIDSIIDGSFPGVKRLSNNNNINGICEVKSFGKRILYDRVGPNTYAIITGFVKKTDSNKGYREFISNRINIYRAYENMIKEYASKPENIAEQDEILKRVYATLGRTVENSKGMGVL